MICEFVCIRRRRQAQVCKGQREYNYIERDDRYVRQAYQSLKRENGQRKGVLVGEHLEVWRRFERRCLGVGWIRQIDRAYSEDNNDNSSDERLVIDWL